MEEGGDWERKNLLKVYEAFHMITKRQFKEAAAVTNTAYITCILRTMLFVITYIAYVTQPSVFLLLSRLIDFFLCTVINRFHCNFYKFRIYGLYHICLLYRINSPC